MFKYFKVTRDSIIQDTTNSIINSLTNGDFTDKEICNIINTVKSRSLAYLRHRRELLSNELEDNIESINKLE